MATIDSKVITVESLKVLHNRNEETYETKDNTFDLITVSEKNIMEMVEELLENKFDKPENDIIPIENGGTSSSDGAIGLSNLFAAGETILSSNQYGDELPAAGNVGRIFFKRLVE